MSKRPTVRRFIFPASPTAAARDPVSHKVKRFRQVRHGFREHSFADVIVNLFDTGQTTAIKVQHVRKLFALQIDVSIARIRWANFVYLNVTKSAGSLDYVTKGFLGSMCPHDIRESE